MEKKVDKPCLTAEFKGSCGHRHRVAVEVGGEWLARKGKNRLVMELVINGVNVRELKR